MPPASGGDEALDWGSFHLYEESENGKAHAETEPEETPETEPETVPEQEGDSETGQQKEPEPETGAENPRSSDGGGRGAREGRQDRGCPGACLGTAVETVCSGASGVLSI